MNYRHPHVLHHNHMTMTSAWPPGSVQLMDTWSCAKAWTIEQNDLFLQCPMDIDRGGKGHFLVFFSEGKQVGWAYRLNEASPDWNSERNTQAE